MFTQAMYVLAIASLLTLVVIISVVANKMKVTLAASIIGVAGVIWITSIMTQIKIMN